MRNIHLPLPDFLLVPPLTTGGWNAEAQSLQAADTNFGGPLDLIVGGELELAAFAFARKRAKGCVNMRVSCGTA
jgi:hypothetical protein